MSTDNVLRIGDYITLKFSKFGAFMSSDGILVEDVGVSSDLHCIEDHVFQIYIQMQYSATNEYEEFVETYPGDISNIQDDSTRKHLDALIRGKNNEIKMNDSFMKLKTGNLVLFGDTVQLFHVKSKKFVTVISNEVARDERENLLVKLDSDGNTKSWLQLIPRYKIDREGDKINNSTEVLLQVAERPGEYLHCSDRNPPRDKLREVNSSLDSVTPWKLGVFQRANEISDRSLLLAGELVYLRDPETQSLLVPLPHPIDIKPPEKKRSKRNDGDDGLSMDFTASVSIAPDDERSHESHDETEAEEEDDVSVTSVEEYEDEYGEVALQPNSEEQLDSNAIWVLESRVFSKGGSVNFRNDYIHLRHLNTGRYLSTRNGDDITADTIFFKLESKPSDKTSLFNVTELHANRDALSNSKAIQIKQGHIYLERGNFHDRQKVFVCGCTRVKTKATNLIITRFEPNVEALSSSTTAENSKEQNSDSRVPILDIFVGKSTYNHMRKFLMNTRIPSPNSQFAATIWPTADNGDRVMFSFMIERIIHFIQGYPISFDATTQQNFVPDSEICKLRQRMFQEQGMLGMLLTMLNILAPISEMTAAKEVSDMDITEQVLVGMGKEVISECLKLLYELIKGNSVNQMHIADYMLVILTHVSTDPIAALVAQEMLSSNRDLQETKIGFKEISIFAEKMRESMMNSMYFNLLQACCSCMGQGIPRNQLTVQDVIFDKFQDLIILVESTNDKSSQAVEWFQSSMSYFPEDNTLARSQSFATGDNATSPVGAGLSMVSMNNDNSNNKNSTVLGYQLYQKGLPVLNLTWASNSSKYSPLALYGKNSVNIFDIMKHLPALLLSSKSFNNSGNRNKHSSIGEIRKMIAEYFIAQMYLVSEMCLGRNYAVMMKMESLYPYEVLVTMMKQPIHDGLKGAAATLVGNLYVDRDPQIETSLPRLTRTWTDVCKGGAVSIISVESARISNFALLQSIISEHIRMVKGKPFHLYSFSYVHLLLKLVQFNFYGSLEKLSDIIDPLVMALKRSDVESDSMSDISANVGLKRSLSTRRGSVSNRKKAIVEDNNNETIDKGNEGEPNSPSHQIDKNDVTPQAEDQDFIMRLHRDLLEFFESLPVMIFMLVLVLFAIVIVIFTVLTGYEGFEIDIINYVIFVFFAIDVSMRCYLHTVVRKSIITFFMDPFNELDLLVVALDVIILAAGSVFGDASRYTKVLRAARMIRLLRIIRAARVFNKMVNMSLKSFQSWEEPIRYKKTPLPTILVMEKMVEVLSNVQKIIEDRNISLLLHEFQKLDERSSLNNFDSAEIVTIFHNVIEQSNELQVSNEAYDDIYIDLLMYNNAKLVQRTLDVLMTHHSSKHILLQNFANLQLLVTSRREGQFLKLERIVTQLKRDSDTFTVWGKLADDSEKKTNNFVFKSLIELTEACRKRREVLKFDEEFEPEKVIQDMLRNLGCFELCMKIVHLISTIDVNDTISECHKNTRRLVQTCNDLLFWMIIDNPTNQHLAYKHIEFFIKTIDERIGSHRIIRAIFSNNETLMKSVPKQYISDFVLLICNSGRFPQYLSLLYAITTAGMKNVISNQYEVIRQISTPGNQKKVLLYFVSQSHADYNKKIKAMMPYLNKKDIVVDDLPADLHYHLELLAVLSRCSVGTSNMTTIEAKIQSMYFFVDVVQAIIDPNCILLAKIRLSSFLYNAMIDVEMRLPSLKDAAVMWKLIELTIEVFEFARDELRQIEKNGWEAPTSHRQKIEYMIVSAMIIHGYFSYYFDVSVFRPELGQGAHGIERVHIKEYIAYNMMKVIYEKIRLIYEMRSPLLAEEHHQILFNALESLNNASAVKIVMKVDNLHYELFDHPSSADVSTSKKNNDNEGKVNIGLVSSEHRKFGRFLDILVNEEQSIRDEANDQIQEFISRLEKIPWKDENANSDVRFEELLQRLIAHVRGCIEIVVHGDETIKQMSENSIKNSTWLLQVFRTMIENRWGMSIFQRDDDGGEEQDEASEKLVTCFNENGATEMCLDLIARGIDLQLQAEAIKLLVGMLFHEGGALEVQITINRHLRKPGSDLFFLHIRSIFQNLISWHKWNGVVIVPEGEDPKLPDEIILVRCLQLMCEGHYGPNQDILREQPNNHTTVNLLDDMVQYLQALDAIKCRTSTTAALAVSALVLEVIQGPCEGNQDYFALRTELIESLNRKMRHRAIHDCVEDEEIELKKGVIDILQGLMEGQAKKTAIYDRILSVIHLDVLQLLCTPPDNNKEKEKKASEATEEGEEEVKKEEGEEESEEAVALRTESLVVMQMLCDYKPSLRSELGLEEDISSLVGDTVACVEVVWRGELQRRFFHVPEICKDLAKSTKDVFITNVDRTSSENKLYGLLDASREMYREIMHQQLLKSLGIAKIFSRTNQDRAAWATFIIAFIINVLFLSYYKAIVIDCSLRNPHDHTMVYDPTFDICTKIGIPDEIMVVTKVLNFFLIISAFYTLVLYLVVRLPVNFQKHCEDDLGVLLSILYTSMDAQTLYYSIYLVLAILGLFNHVILSFLLLDIISKSPIAQGVLNAAYKPKKTIIMTLVLTFIIIYIYAMYAFFLYNDSTISYTGSMPFNYTVNVTSIVNGSPVTVLETRTNYTDDYTYNMGNFMDRTAVRSLDNLFKDFLRYGAPGGAQADLNVNIYSWRFISDVVFFLAMFVMWNIIKGITIDTFVELRTDLDARVEDTEERCFICGIDKQVFNRSLDREAFDLHIKNDQNLWNYIYFIVYIWEQDKDDDDGLETYVRKCITSKDLSWFPMNKAIRLSEHQHHGDTDSLSYQLRHDLTKLDETFSTKITSFKDNLQRAVARVEHIMSNDAAGIDYQPSRRKARGSASLSTASNLDGQSIEDVSINMVTRGGLEDDSMMDDSNKMVHMSITKLTGLILPESVLSHISCRVTCDSGDFVVFPSTIHHRQDMKDETFVAFHRDILVRNSTTPTNTSRPDMNQDQSNFDEGAVLDFEGEKNVPLLVHRGSVPLGSNYMVRIQIVSSKPKKVEPDGNESMPDNVAVFIGAVYIPVPALIAASESGGTLEATFQHSSVIVPELKHHCSVQITASVSSDLIEEHNNSIQEVLQKSQELDSLQESISVGYNDDDE